MALQRFGRTEATTETSPATRTRTEDLHPLSKEEIDLQIEWIATRVACVEGLPEHGLDGDPLRPRWITAAELVRRMRPFLVLN